MNIVNRLTLKHMKYNKRQTIVTIIGITLAVAMISAVSVIGSTVMDYLGRCTDSSMLARYEDAGSVVGIGKIILTAVIMIAAISLIVNGFIISIAERTRYLGMLASVGATSRQKRESVYFEGFIEGIISIPIGLFIGIGGIGAILELFEPMVKRVTGSNEPLRLVVDAETVIWAVVFSILTIAISAYIPAKRAADISPVAAIRQERDIKVSARDLYTNGFAKKVFGFEGELALKNIKRNKKRYKTIVYAMFISIVLFITANSVMDLLWADVEYNNRDRGYDMMVSETVWGDGISFTDISYWENFEKVTDKLIKLPYVQKSTRFFVTAAMASFIGDMDDSMYSDEYLEYEEKTEPSERLIYVNIIFMTEDELKEYLENIGISYDEFTADKYNVLFYDGIVISDERYHNVNAFVGDVYKDTLQSITVDMHGDMGGSTTKEFKIYSNEEKLMGMSDEPYILITNEMAESLLEHQWFIYGNEAYFETNNAIKFEQEFEKIKSKVLGMQNIYEDEVWEEIETPHLHSYVEKREKQENLYTLIKVGTYSFIGLVSVLCIANIINTLSTGMALRRREFAMLKSMGMTNSKFRKMIICEGILYSIKALIYGLPVGFLIDVIIKCTLQPGFGVKVQPNLMSYVVVLVAVFIVIGVTMLYATGKTRKDNIVETLRNENV